MKLSQIFLILIASTFLLSSCKKSKAEEFTAALDRLEPELAVANTPAEKITILETFARQYEGYPQTVDLQKRIDRLKEEQQSEKTNLKKDDTETKTLSIYDRITAGDPSAFREFIVQAVLLKSSNAGAAIEPVSVDAFGRALTFKHEANFIPTQFRISVASQMRNSDKSWAGCTAPCQNEKANTILKSVLGGDLFDKDGKLNSAQLKKLMGLLDADTYGKLTKKEMLILFTMSLQKTLAIREAMRKDGDLKLLKKFREIGKDDPSSYRDWYDNYATENSNYTKLTASKYEKGKTFGFWMRRMDDGSADIIEEAIKTFLSEE